MIVLKILVLDFDHIISYFRMCESLLSVFSVGLECVLRHTQMTTFYRQIVGLCALSTPLSLIPFLTPPVTISLFLSLYHSLILFLSY